MTLTFVTNLVHHHQLPVADEFYKILGDDYHYIATKPLPEWLIKGGYDPNLNRTYIIRTYQSDVEMAKARRLIDESDVVIIGSAPADWVYERKKANKITFHYNERWLRFGAWRRLMPKSLYGIWRNHFQFRNKRTYMLCASAFTAKDVHTFFCYPNKCFKWGYFTKVDSDFEVEAREQGASTSEITPIMWCARFLKLKHPELPVQLAARLKANGFNFVLDMYGSGEELKSTQTLAERLDVSDVVHFCGNLPNDQILKAMREHRIFLFTSDKNEGWGAVLNESMSNGCAVVGSHEIGSVPYLIKDGLNGMIFKSKNLDSLYEKVTRLMDDKALCSSIRAEAVKTMRDVWSPKNAVLCFLNLVQYIQANELNKYDIISGPASWD